MCSGIQPTADLAGSPYIQRALEASLGGFGPIFIVVAMVLFAFTTLIGNLFYVDKAILHIVGKEPRTRVKNAYYLGFSLLILLGAGLSADLLWNISDIFMGAMTLINIPALLILSKYAFRAINDYTKKVKEGKEITFRASDIGLSEPLDYWQD